VAIVETMSGLPTTVLSENDARERFLAEQCAILGTVTEDGAPHLVPVTFVHAAVDGAEHLYIAVDHKPKRSTSLKRLRNIAAEPRVSVLVNHYDQDWNHLWWVKVDGHATVSEFAQLPAMLPAVFQAKYNQYVRVVPNGPVIDITIDRWTSWAFAEV
jgi:PPOX class probable F420-dependent enzyme